MPVTKQNIPNPSDIVKWPYLKDVRLHNINADVDLLIGTDAPVVMEPWQIINNQEEGPYAVRTLLGWVVNGPLKGRGKSHSLSANGISLVNIQELLVSQYNNDFNEKSHEETKEMSIEDKKIHEGC